jgi:hypothetical protein
LETITPGSGEGVPEKGPTAPRRYPYLTTLSLLLRFVHDTTGKAPSTLEWDELDEPVIAAFLEYLETERRNSARTRNLRLTAIRSLFSYAAVRHPEHAAVIGRVLSILLRLLATGDQPVEEVSRRPCSLALSGVALGGGSGFSRFALFTTFLQIGDWRRHPRFCRIAAVGSG